jgi:hypothetical protein
MQRSKDEKEFCELGWRLIELKVAYYKPECVHISWKQKVTVSDDDYDAMELRYLELCMKLRAKHSKENPGSQPYPLNTNVHKGWPGYEELCNEDHAMMEVDETRPSVQLVMHKLGLDEQTRRPPRDDRTLVTG